MLVWIGLVGWLVALAALARVLRTGRDDDALRVRWWLWAAMAAIGVVFLFRPNEDILGGEEPGSYVNSAATFARVGRMFYQDPLLAQVPQEQRGSFLCGHAGFGLTKDACLCVRDLQTARIGPWFQPPYAVLMSPVARFGQPSWVLYVAPLLGVMTALALAALGVRLFRRREVVCPIFLLYLLSPVIAWNARSPRAEIGAAFFLIAGWALLAEAWTRGRWKATGDLLLGAVCLGLAPLFHITAWYGVLPTYALIVLICRGGRDDFLPALLIALAAVAAFVAQVRFVTDCYDIGGLIAKIARHALLLSVAGAIAFVALALASVVAARRGARGMATPADWLVGLWARWWTRAALVAFVLIALVAAHTFRDAEGHIPHLAQRAGFPILADFPGLVRMVSLPVAVAGLAGWLWLMLRSRGRTAFAAAFLLAMLPGVLLTGWMNNYMMETRRLVIFVVPLLALGLTGLVTGCADAAGRGRKAVAVGLTLVFLGAGAWGKPQLYTGTDYKGFARFLGGFAQKIRAENGILLGEYSRIAAPFEHLFGIPTLALDETQRPDYAPAEEAWAAVMQANPDRPAFFLTPFQPPLSKRFAFEPVKQQNYADDVLRGERQQVPRATTWGVTLSLYRMTLRGASQSVSNAFPYVVRAGAGNMGVRGFDGMRREDTSVAGNWLNAGQALDVAGPADAKPVKKILLPCLCVGEKPPPPHVVIMAPPLTGFTRWHAVGGGWWLAECVLGKPAELRKIRVVPQIATLAGGLFFVMAEGDVVPGALPQSVNATRLPIPPIDVRWARAECSLLAPVPASGKACLLLLASGPAKRGPVDVSVAAEQGAAATVKVESGDWGWYAVPVAAGSSAGGATLQWLQLRTSPPWDPQLPRAPHDLGILTAYAVVVAAE